MGAAAPTRGAEHVAKEKTTINKSQPTTTTTAAPSTNAEKGSSSSSKVNTTTLEDTVEFQTSAHELYETLLDTQRVCAWTRGPAKISKEKGSKFELFNGNVRGELLDAVSLTVAKECKDEKTNTMHWSLCCSFYYDRFLIKRLFNHGVCNHGPKVEIMDIHKCGVYLPKGDIDVDFPLLLL